MSSEKNKNPNANDNSESSSKIDALIEALYPLCADLDWMQDTIEQIRATELPDTDFELSGLARKIAYEIIKQHPDYLTEHDSKTTPLKELIIQYNNNIDVAKKRKENLAKIAEEVFNNGAKELANKLNNRAKSR